MRYEDIKTYVERCENFDGIVTNQIVVDRLLEEIDELREYIETKRKPLTDEEILKVYDDMFNQIVGPNYRQRRTVLFARAIERAHGIGGEV